MHTAELYSGLHALDLAHGSTKHWLITWTLQEYNTAADRLQLIPTTAKRAGGMHFEARLNRGGSTSLEIMNVDLKVAKLSPLSSTLCFICCHLHPLMANPSLSTALTQAPPT